MAKNLQRSDVKEEIPDTPNRIWRKGVILCTYVVEPLAQKIAGDFASTLHALLKQEGILQKCICQRKSFRAKRSCAACNCIIKTLRENTLYHLTKQPRAVNVDMTRIYEDPWELAKLFMSKMGKDAERCKSSGSTKLSYILEFLSHSPLFCEKEEEIKECILFMDMLTTKVKDWQSRGSLDADSASATQLEFRALLEFCGTFVVMECFEEKGIAKLGLAKVNAFLEEAETLTDEALARIMRNYENKSRYLNLIDNAEDYFEEMKFSEAIEELTEAMGLSGIRDDHLGSTFLMRARCYLHKYFNEESKVKKDESIELARKDAERATELNRKEKPHIYSVLGQIYQEIGRYEESLVLYEKTCSLTDETELLVPKIEFVRKQLKKADALERQKIRRGAGSNAYKAIELSVIHHYEKILNKHNVSVDSISSENGRHGPFLESVAWFCAAYHEKEKDKESYKEMLLKSARLGNPLGMFNLGECYRTGYGVKRSPLMFVYWAERAISCQESEDEFSSEFNKDISYRRPGVADALYFLGFAYIDGISATKDTKVGLDFLTRSARLGFPMTLTALGNFYLEGNLVENDISKAIGLFKAGAAKGDWKSMLNLAKIYSELRYGNKNLQLARSYARVALLYGRGGAERALEASSTSLLDKSSVVELRSHHSLSDGSLLDGYGDLTYFGVLHRCPMCPLEILEDITDRSKLAQGLKKIALEMIDLSFRALGKGGGDELMDILAGLLRGDSSCQFIEYLHPLYFERARKEWELNRTERSASILAAQMPKDEGMSDQLKEFHEVFPGNPMFKKVFADVLRLSGSKDDIEEAVRLRKSVLEESAIDLDNLFSLGILQRELGDLSGALSSFLRFEAEIRDHDQDHLRLSEAYHEIIDCYLVMGENLEARRYYEVSKEYEHSQHDIFLGDGKRSKEFSKKFADGSFSLFTSIFHENMPQIEEERSCYRNEVIQLLIERSKDVSRVKQKRLEILAGPPSSTKNKARNSEEGADSGEPVQKGNNQDQCITLERIYTEGKERKYTGKLLRNCTIISDPVDMGDNSTFAILDEEEECGIIVCRGVTDEFHAHLKVGNVLSIADPWTRFTGEGSLVIHVIDISNFIIHEKDSPKRL